MPTAEKRPEDAEPNTQEQARAIADAERQAAERQATETVDGGRYAMPDGSYVDADGKPLKS